MSEYRYILQPYTGKNSRYTCPQCGKHSQFTRNIDIETGEQLPHHVGICNRIDKCGYHYTPKQYFLDNGLKPKAVEDYIAKPQSQNQPISYIDDDIFKASLKNYNDNNLVKFLHKKFDACEVNGVISLYKIGTSNRWGGGTSIFWQIDHRNNVRTGKLIKYNPDTGKRIKFDGGSLTNWVHSVLDLEDFNLKQCLFGEHLLSQFPNKIVGIVESEKTALVASICLPDLVWLATGGVGNLNSENVKPLRGRNVILFPDASKDGIIYQKWKDKAEHFGYEISDFLEQFVNDKQKNSGVDIADFLVNEKKRGEPKTKSQQKEIIVDYIGTTHKIPYNTPSPVAIIDSKIENPPKFVGQELVVKNRIFTSTNGDKIELVGIRDYGYCGNWKTHKKANGYCRACLLNCFHTLKINCKLQNREFTHLEVLTMSS